MSNSHSDQPVVIVERSAGGLGGFLLGLAVGAGVALLFAPRNMRLPSPGIESPSGVNEVTSPLGPIPTS